MGRLLNSQGMQTGLKTMHVFGRDINVVDIQLSSALCSRLQCVLRFNRDGWQLIDKSKNGTFINCKRMQAKQSTLSEGDIISFPGDKAEWKLIDASAPKPMLVNEENNKNIELSVVNILPSEENPELILVCQADRWVVEKDDNAWFIQTGNILKIAEADWLFYANDLMHETVTYLSILEEAVPRLHFYISLNEENVRLVMHLKGDKVDFGYKSHHQLLLFLARHRIVDEQRNTALIELGWLATDILLIELGIESNHLNILIYRLRKAFENIGFSGLLIERRQGEIRLCECNISLRKGNEYLESAGMATSELSMIN